MKQEGDQSIFKMGVKRWLKEQNLDYKWMADQCGVSEITVRNWMSQKIIPPLKQQLIERVMVQMPAAQPTSSPNSIPDIQVDVSLSLSVKLSPELYKQLEAKAAPTDTIEVSDEHALVTQTFKAAAPGLSARGGIRPGVNADLKNPTVEKAV